jgi:riboflavin kinase/FMN adenylyltransferase
MTTSLEQQLSELSIAGGSAAAVGTFDGVHLGHRKLLATVIGAAAENGLTSLAITFSKQPRAVLSPEKPTTYLASLDRRVETLKSTGIGHVVTVDFDDRLRTKSAMEFLEALKRHAGLKALAVGPGARLGHDRVEAPRLKKLAEGIGIRVISVDPVIVAGQPVSSSAIREALTKGDVDTAAAMLGRPYAIDGAVAHGDKRGRELGFPTANIDPDPGLAVPADGIYATVAEVDGERKMAATSIGVRPTFGGGARLVEAYLLDYSGDLYGRRIGLEFVRRLRGEIKFDGVEALVQQMNRDVEETRAVLSGVI